MSVALKLLPSHLVALHPELLRKIVLRLYPFGSTNIDALRVSLTSKKDASLKDTLASVLAIQQEIEREYFIETKSTSVSVLGHVSPKDILWTMLDLLFSKDGKHMVCLSHSTVYKKYRVSFILFNDTNPPFTIWFSEINADESIELDPQFKSLLFSPTEDALFVVSAFQILIYEKKEGWKHFTKIVYDREIDDINPDGNSIISMDTMNQLRIFNLKDEGLLTTFQIIDDTSQNYRGGMFNKDGTKYITYSSNKIRIYELDLKHTDVSKRITEIGVIVDSSISTAALSPTGNQLIYTKEDTETFTSVKYVYKWVGNHHIWQPTILLTGGHSPNIRVESLCFSPDGKLLASYSSKAHECCVWNAIRGDLLAKFEKLHDFTKIAFQNNTTLIAMGHNYKIRIYNLSPLIETQKEPYLTPKSSQGGRRRK